jgi:hypothetical protein
MAETELRGRQEHDGANTGNKSTASRRLIETGDDLLLGLAALRGVEAVLVEAAVLANH